MADAANMVCAGAKQALDGPAFDGMSAMAGGFDLCGIPEILFVARRDAGVQASR